MPCNSIVSMMMPIHFFLFFNRCWCKRVMIPSGLLSPSGVEAPSATYGSSCCAWPLELLPTAAPVTGDAMAAGTGVEARTGAGCTAGLPPVKLVEPKMSNESARTAVPAGKLKGTGACTFGNLSNQQCGILMLGGIGHCTVQTLEDH